MRRWAIGLAASLTLMGGAAEAQMLKTLHDSITEPAISAEVDIGKLPHSSVQVTVETGTCTDLDIMVEGLNGGTTWAPLPIVGGSASITETDVPINASRMWAIPAGPRRIRVHANTVSSCPVSVYFAGNP